MATTQEISFKFGPMYGQIRDRLNEQGFDIPDDVASHAESIRKSVLLLSLHGYIPNSVTERCFARLAKEVAHDAKAQNGRDVWIVWCDVYDMPCARVPDFPDRYPSCDLKCATCDQAQKGREDCGWQIKRMSDTDLRLVP